MSSNTDPTARALLDAIEQRAGEFIALRRDLHRHPELGLREQRTAQIVADRLASWGYEIDRGLATTGVVGTLRRGSGAKRLGLRADMDALPIQEASGQPWASVHDGVMHACGHDGHTAMLLAAAAHLAARGHFNGRKQGHASSSLWTWWIVEKWKSILPG